MKVFIQSDEKKIPIDYDHFNAYYGFKQMGFETIFFNKYEEIENSDRADIIVGYLGPVKIRLRDFNIEIPNIDYPETIAKFLGRKILKSTINTINNNPQMWNVFIKPINNKNFSGRVIRTAQDLIGCGFQGNDQDIYVSEIIDFVSEYRVFVRYGTVMDMRHYNGDWSILPNTNVINNCIAEYTNSPDTYAIDFGVTKTGETYLIEVNVSGSIGSYGLDPVLYAKFMSARWAELTHTEDECRFDIT